MARETAFDKGARELRELFARRGESHPDDLIFDILTVFGKGKKFARTRKSDRERELEHLIRTRGRGPNCWRDGVPIYFDD